MSGQVILGGQAGWSLYRVATGEIVAWGLGINQPSEVAAGMALLAGHWPGDHWRVVDGVAVRKD